MSHNLSKSRYTQFRCCEKALWLNVFKPEMAIIDADTQDRFKVGIEVGDLAKNLLGDYQDMTTRLPDGRLDYARMIEKTKIAVSLGVENICEAAFSYEGNYCAVDLLHKIENGYQLYEVKSSTSPDKDIFAWDVAYQKFVLTGCGINVVGTYLVCINNEYVRHGDLDLHQFFNIEDISVPVETEYPNVADNVRRAIHILEGDEPDTSLSASCEKPYKCAFREYCMRDIPKPSVFDLYRLSSEKKIAHYRAGRIRFEDIRDSSLNTLQRMQVECTLNGTSHFDKEGIRRFLDTLRYPLYFLDFETIQPAIPLFDETRPYQQLVTQYSLHYQEEKGGEVFHKEFLAPSRGNPQRQVAEQLCKDIPTQACLLVYNKSFECRRLKELANLFPDLSEHLLAMVENTKDLLDPFRNGHYYLPAMGGSFSIKSVLPALFPDDPELDYHLLDEICQNGGQAMNLFPQLKDLPAEDELRARQALLDYCRLDTLAMVKLLEKLYDFVENEDDNGKSQF